LLQGVEMTAGLDRAAAERIVRATLATLVERLGREDFVPLAARLPDQLRQPPGEAAAEPAPFPPEEFVRRAARRAGIDQDSAWVQSRGGAGHLAAEPGRDGVDPLATPGLRQLDGLG
jgi:uncharacterized protein (DUF2267 family)